MSQLWALVASDGTFVLRFTHDPSMHPKDEGCMDECMGKKVWPLDRSPDTEHGEFVDPNTGKFIFASHLVQPGRSDWLTAIITQIKQVAARRIDQISPDWKQRNDLRAPSPEGEARFAEIDRVREWSNTMEALAETVSSVEEAKSLLIRIQNGS